MKNRDYLKDKEWMVSPASGRIIGIKERTIAIFMRIYNIHTTVAPLSGIVKERKYEKGNFKPAFLKSSVHNEKNTIKLSTKHGDIKILQIAGLLAKRIKCEVKEGERVDKGQRIGKIYLGSRVEVNIPESFEIIVKKGYKVKYGKTTIGR